MCPQGYYCPETGLSIALQCVENSGTLGPGSIDCICDQGYFLSNGSCIYNVTTTIETLESSTYSLNSDLESSTDSSKNDYPLMTSPVTTDAPSNSKFTAYTSLSDLKPHGHSIHSDRVSSYKTTTGTVRNTDGIVGLALSNPLAMSIVLVTSVVMMIAIFNVCRAEIRLAKVRDMRKKGIIANFADNDGLQTSGDTTFADNGADA